ncbi:MULTISPECIES: hypothetical protein [unclassified Bradyrhizobium]|uniref:hypothetical protein n=1 Tax=unclassified Bradyrhizobium TaxID=2631580 RepID=UPI003392684F
MSTEDNYKQDSGKVWRDPKGGQHYVTYMFRDVWYRLTGNYRSHRGKIIAEGKAEDGSTTWADEDGNFYGP